MAKFGAYELLERIGAGGMGEIYLAVLHRDDGFEKLLVIKRVLPELGRTDEFLGMFNREARVAALLNHQNIVQVYDYGRQGDEYFIAMEYVHGADLRTLLSRLGAPAIPVAHAVLTGIARALSYAHRLKDRSGNQLSLVHRDVSPGNVLLSSDGDVKLTDFGLVTGEAADFKTDGGTMKGKYAYMSPEQTYGDAVDARSDLFSWGIVAYEMLAGRRPFTGDVVEVINGIRNTKFEPLDDSVLAPLRELVHQTLRRHREERPQNADEVVARLADIAHEQVWQNTPDTVGAWVRPVERVLSPKSIATVERTEVGKQPIRTKVASSMDETRTAGFVGDGAPTAQEPPAPQPEVARIGPSVATRLAFGSGLLAVAAVILLVLWGPGTEPRPQPTEASGGPATSSPSPVSYDVSLVTRPAGGQISVDGSPVGTAPLVLRGLIENTRVLVLSELSGHEQVQRAFRPEDLHVGDRGREIQLIHLPLPATLELASVPDAAQVFLDGRSIGLTPLRVEVTDFGERSLRFEREDTVAEVRTVQVEPGGAVSLNVPLTLLHSVRLISTPSEANVAVSYADGQSLNCTTPCEMVLPAGEALFTVSADGFYHSADQPRLIGANEELTFELRPTTRTTRAQWSSRDLDLGGDTRDEVNGSVQQTVRFESTRLSGSIRASLSEGAQNTHVAVRVSSTPWSAVQFNGATCNSPCEISTDLEMGRHRLTLVPEGSGEARDITLNLRQLTQ